MKKQIKQIFNPLSGGFDSIHVTDATKDTSQLMQLTADESLSDWTNISNDLSISKVDPLFGDASYELEMVNLAAATYKVMPVDIGFRGTTVALTLNYLMPQGSARVRLLDQDNEVIEGSTFDIPAANGKEKFGTTVFIPNDVTGIRFQAESRDTVAGQVFKFDNVQLSSDLLKSVDIEGDYQSETLLNVGNLTQATDLASFSSTDVKSSGSLIYTKSTSGIRILRDAYVSVSYFNGLTTGGNALVNNTFLNGVLYGGNGSSTSYRATSGISQHLKKDDVITFEGVGNTATYSKVTISATARTKSIVAPTDQVTERSIAFRWRSAADGITEANLSTAGKIGDFVTGQYSTGGVLTQATVRPTQTDEDVNKNGFHLYRRGAGSASTALLPARVLIKLAEPNTMTSCELYLFKDTTKTITGSLDFYTYSSGSTNCFGVQVKMFNPSTGILTIDMSSFGMTQNNLLFSDMTMGTDGYICFTASKLAQGVAIPTPARYVVKTYQSGDTWYEVCNDGWVRQGDRATGTAQVTKTYLIPMNNSNYTVYGSVNTNNNNNAGGWRGLALAASHNSTSITIFLFSDIQDKQYVVEGYGNSATVKSHGAKPNY